MRVENVKGAVWTVDELEFHKRRPQRSTTAAAAAIVFSSASSAANNTASSSSSIIGLMNESNIFGFGYVYLSLISFDTILKIP